LCPEVSETTYRVVARSFENADAEVELFHFGGMFQWFHQTTCNVDDCVGLQGIR